MLFKRAELERVVSKHNDRHTWYSIVHGCVVPKVCKKNTFYKANRDESVSQSESICVSVMVSPQMSCLFTNTTRFGSENVLLFLKFSSKL